MLTNGGRRGWVGWRDLEGLLLRHIGVVSVESKWGRDGEVVGQEQHNSIHCHVHQSTTCGHRQLGGREGREGGGGKGRE